MKLYVKAASAWDDSWREQMKQFDEDCFVRLCECRNRKADILKIAQYMKEANPSRESEECLERAFEWVTDWNNQYDIDLTVDEYKRYLSKI